MTTPTTKRRGLAQSFRNMEGESNQMLQKLQRLRVNRVALVQDIRVEHILNHLLNTEILNEEDKKSILSPRTAQDKARVLIDRLPRKFSGKNKDWYGQFREALKNPESRSSEVKKKYERLLHFMDNTIIHLPKPPTPVSKSDANVEAKHFPRYDPLPHIEKGQHENPENSLKDLTNPDNFASLIKVPEEHFERLRQSDKPEDQIQLEKEENALENLRKVEILYALDWRGLLPEDFEISQSEAVQSMLADETLYCYYLKYLIQLKMERRMNIVEEIGASFVKYISEFDCAKDDEIREKITKIGFGLFEILCQLGDTNKAESVILGLMNYLSTYTAIENWMALYEGCVKMMIISNKNMDLKQTGNTYNIVCGVAKKIHMMSFGLDLLDESRMYSEMSFMMREQGSVDPAVIWADKAIKEVEEENADDVVDVLCCASLAYTVKWNIKKAEELAIEAVQRARASFGTRHPTYVKALLHYVYYSNEFRQDEMGVKVARVALQLCKQIYGTETPTIQKALAHQALAKALVANKQFQDEEYLEQALKAKRAAMDVVPGGHPRLALFSYTIAQCLQWRAVHQENPTDKKESLIWAESEAKAAQEVFKSFWGECSLKAIQADCLLGQIYAKMDKIHYATMSLKSAKSITKVSISPKSNFTALMHAILGTFYKTIDKPQESVEMLEKAVSTVDCGGVYLEWVHTCYETLVAQLRATNEDLKAEKYQAELVDWMKKNPKPSTQISWNELHQKPKPLAEFKKEFLSVNDEVKLKLAKRGLKNLKANLAAAKSNTGK